jgi:hypothetical protein
MTTCQQTPKCDDALCPGWGWFNGCEIQRCDACDRFANDDSARRHVRRCGRCQRLLRYYKRAER